MKRDNIRKRLAIGASGAALLWAGLIAGSIPARAFDDKVSAFDPLMNFVGLGKDSAEKPDIDFRERPNLVVPKSAELPPPQPAGSGRAGNWPVDQDVARRRSAMQAERAPRGINPNANPSLDKAEMMRGRTAEKPNSQELCDGGRSMGGVDCGRLTPVDKIKKVFSLGSTDDTDVTTPGVEPGREYLTEPPRGYRKATTVTRATQAAPNKVYTAPTPAEYARGVDPNKPKDD